MNTKLNFSAIITLLFFISSPLSVYASEEYFNSQMRETAYLRMQGSTHFNHLPCRERSHTGFVTIHDVKSADWEKEKDQLEKKCMLLMCELVFSKLDKMENILDEIEDIVESLPNEIRSITNEMRNTREEIEEERHFSDERETIETPTVQSLSIEEGSHEKFNIFDTIDMIILALLIW